MSAFVVNKLISFFKSTYKLCRLTFYRLIDSCAYLSKKTDEKALLIIRLDAIGDYVLFRNFLEQIYSSPKFRGHKLILVGNQAWREVAEELDGRFIFEFIWVDRRKFVKNLFYRLNMLREVGKRGYKCAISPVYSREFLYSDSIVRAINSKVKIGMIGDLVNSSYIEHKISNSYYDKLISTPDKLLFEFHINKFFFEEVLGNTLNIQRPEIILKSNRKPLNLPDKYIVLFIGGSTNLKRWSVINYSLLAINIYKKYALSIVLCGGSDVVSDALIFSQCFEGEYLDLVGKLSLLDLSYVLSRADMLISNETVAPHFAAALGVPRVFVIYAGCSAYGRFTPYPLELSKGYDVIYHPSIEKDLNRYSMISNSYGHKNKLNINEISVDRVLSIIEEKCFSI